MLKMVIRKDVKGVDCSLFKGITEAFSLRDCGRPQNTSVRRAGKLDVIRTMRIPSICLEANRYTKLLGR